MQSTPGTDDHWQRELAKVRERNKELEDQVAALQDDVAQLCQRRGSSLFSSGYVMAERVAHADREINSLRARLKAAESERDDLHAQAATAHKAEQQLGTGLEDARQALAAAQAEATFFRGQAAEAQQERDQAASESARLQQQATALQQRLQQCEQQLAAADTEAQQEQVQRRAAVEQLEAARRELAAAREEAQAHLHQLAELPLVRKQLERSEAALAELAQAHAEAQEAHDALRVQLQEAQTGLAAAQRGSEALRKELKEAQGAASAAQGAGKQQLAPLQTKLSKMQTAVNEMRQQRDDAQRSAEQTMGALLAAQAAVMELQASRESGMELVRQEAAQSARELHTQMEEAQAKLAALQLSSKAQLQVLEGALRAAATEKAAALTRLGAAQSALDDSTAHCEVLEAQCHTLKLRLAAATEQKVQALLKAADAEQEVAGVRSRRGSGSAASGSAAATPPGALAGLAGPEGGGHGAGDGEEAAPLDPEELADHLQERLDNLQRLLPLATRFRSGVARLQGQLLAAGAARQQQLSGRGPPQPAGGKGGGGGAGSGPGRQALAELSRLEAEHAQLRRRLGLENAAAEHADGQLRGSGLSDLQLMPVAASPAEPSSPETAGRGHRDAPVGPEPMTPPGVEASGNAAATCSGEGEEGGGEAVGDADELQLPLPPGARRQRETGQLHGGIAAALAHGQRQAASGSDGGLAGAAWSPPPGLGAAGRLDRALAREVVGLVGLNLQSLRSLVTLQALGHL